MLVNHAHTVTNRKHSTQWARHLKGEINMMYYSSDCLSREERKKLNKRYANCKRLRGSSWVWESGPNEISLISYEKTIATFRRTTKPYAQLWFVYDAFECSATTSRHISEFLKRYVGCLSFQECKKFIMQADYNDYEIINGVCVGCYNG